MAAKAIRDFMIEQVTIINEILAKSKCSADRRQGQIDVIMNMLHRAKMYKGFTYLSLDEVPDGELPGIVIHGTIENTPADVRFANTDSTRIRIFT